MAKGSAEVKRIHEAGKAAAAKQTAKQRARQENRGSIADEQAASIEGPKKKQPGLAGYPNYEDSDSE
jgi:hypothetical protein